LSVAESIETRPSAPARLRAPLRQRGLAFALALAVELLVALLLWFMAPILSDEKPPPTTTIFGVDTVPGDTEEPARTERRKAAAKSAARERRSPNSPNPSRRHPHRSPSRRRSRRPSSG
jgi:protein TonB